MSRLKLECDFEVKPTSASAAPLPATQPEKEEVARGLYSALGEHGELKPIVSDPPSRGHVGPPTTVPDIPGVTAHREGGGGSFVNEGRLVLTGDLGLDMVRFGTIPQGFAAEAWVEDINGDGKLEVCHMDVGGGGLQAYRWTGDHWIRVKIDEDRMPAVPLKLTAGVTYDPAAGRRYLELALTNTGKLDVALERRKETRRMLYSLSSGGDYRVGLYVGPPQRWGEGRIQFKGTIEPGKTRTVRFPLTIGSNHSIPEPDQPIVVSGWASWDDKVEPFFRAVRPGQESAAHQSGKPGKP